MRRALLAAFAVGVLVLLTGAPASAHASLLSFDPGDGTVVATMPAQVVLTFNEPVRLDSVHAFTPDGGDWSVDASAQDNRVVVVPQEDPGAGTVVVAWKVISADGHLVGGSVTFSIGSPSAGAPASGSAEPTVTRGAEIARWVAFGVLVGALGAIVLVAAVVAVRGALPARWTHHGLVRGLQLLWNMALAAALALVPLLQIDAVGGSLRDALDWLTWLDGLARGSTWLLLAAVLLATGLVAMVRRTARPRRGSLSALRPVTAVLAVAVAAPVLGAVATAPDPASGGTAASAPVAAATGAQTAELGDAGSVTVSLRQAGGRTYRLRLTLTTSDGVPLRPFAMPAVSLSDADVDLGEVTLRRTGPGAYDADVVIPRGGEWSVEVSVRITEFDNPVAVVPVSLG